MAYFNLAAYALASSIQQPDKTALEFVDGASGEFVRFTFSYGDLNRWVQKAADDFLQLDFHPGDRIILRLEHSPRFGILYLASILSLVPVAVSPQLTGSELSYLIEDAGPRAVVYDGPVPDATPELLLPSLQLLPELAVLQNHPPQIELDLNRWHKLVPTQKEDPAFLIYTSGTTGKPKGVLHAQRSLLGRAPMYRYWFGISPEDRLLHAGEFNWTYTLGVGFKDPLVNGATVILYRGPREDATLWPELIYESRATLFAAVPSLYRRILKYAGPHFKDQVATLRHGLTAGEALKPGLLADWQERTGKELYEALGMSEISTYVSSCPEVPTKPGSPGKPQTGRKLAVLEPEAFTQGTAKLLPVGETGLLGVFKDDPGLMLGYWQQGGHCELPLCGDWFCGGDTVAFDEDGYIQFAGRNDDMMNSFGYRVSPMEVEAALAALSFIGELAVAEVTPPDKTDITLIAAFIVPADPAVLEDENKQAACEAELLAVAETKLARYKRPRLIRWLPALPRTVRGKLQRSALKI